jgi:hypothetical protein
MKSSYLAAVALALLAGRANAADTPSFTKDVKPFLKNYCLECHGGSSTKKGINVESFASMMKARSFVVPKSPERSRLYLVMTGGGKQMPPKKYGSFPTKAEIAMIKAWIAAGAKDDTDTKTPEKDAPESKGGREQAAIRRDLIDPHGGEE